LLGIIADGISIVYIGTQSRIVSKILVHSVQIVGKSAILRR